MKKVYVLSNQAQWDGFESNIEVFANREDALNEFQKRREHAIRQWEDIPYYLNENFCDSFEMIGEDDAEGMWWKLEITETEIK